MNKLKVLYKHLKSWYLNVYKVRSKKYRLPFLKRIKYNLHLFSEVEYFAYNFDNNDWRNYISEYERLNSREINGNYRLILDDKILFEEIFGNYVRVPKNFAYIDKGKIFELHNSGLNNDNIIKFINSQKIVMLKLLNSGGGQGVYKIEYSNPNNYLINGVVCDTSYLKNLIYESKCSIISEYISQADFSNRLFPKTANTIRIVCIKDKASSDFKICKAVQRIGCEKSIPVDNLSSGGLVAEIDLETGKLSAARQKYRDTIEIINYSKHPDCGSKIKDLFIPNWNNIKAEILELTNKFPYLNFIAWDVLLTEEGICIIEGNASSGVDLFQLDKGIRNSDYAKSLRDYGFIK